MNKESKQRLSRHNVEVPSRLSQNSSRFFQELVFDMYPIRTHATFAGTGWHEVGPGIGSGIGLIDNTVAITK